MGQQLSAPITTAHVERVNSPIFHSSVVSVQGWRLTMEDDHNICPKLNDKGMMLFGVYDGHGGSLAAEYLSRVVPAAFSTLESITDFDDITEKMLQVDEDFLSSGNCDGATLCFVLGQLWDTGTDQPILQSIDEVDPNNENLAIKIVSVNVGDSRAMIIRKTGEYVAITEDHKPYDEKERSRIVNAGGFVANYRVDGNLALSRAIGDKDYKMNTDLPPDKQKVIAIPDFQQHYLNRGDVLIVCCDGIFEAQSMTYLEVANTVKHSIQDNTLPDRNVWDPAAVSRDLIEASLMSDSKDNHSSIVVHFTSEKPLDLPEKECIPGPLQQIAADDDDDSYSRKYKEDLSRYGYTYDDLRDVIGRIDEEIKLAKGLHTTEATKLDLKKIGTSLHPLIRPQQHQGKGTPPQMANFLFSALMNNRDDENDMYNDIYDN